MAIVKISKTASGYRVGASALYITDVGSVKEAREVLTNSIAHQWLSVNYLPRTVRGSRDIPSTDSASFQQKAFYLSVRNLVLQLYYVYKLPIAKACKIGNRCFSKKPLSMIGFAEEIINYPKIKDTIQDIVAYQCYK